MIDPANSPSNSVLLREHARAIWQAGVEAVQPERCLAEAVDKLDSLSPEFPPLNSYDRILVAGAGKGGAAMSRALEAALERKGIPLSKVTGFVNVPNETVAPLKAIRLHPARPTGTNQPTEAALKGTQEILQCVASAGANDLLICLISGGGSALLPAPVDSVTLADKQRVTELLDRSGATIQEMNAVRKHLSKIKGGGLVRHFRGRRILGLIISDVIGDPLDVIASGPTCVDPTTFADALAVLDKYQLVEQTPVNALAYLLRGAAGQEPETLKQEPFDQQKERIIHNLVIANNQRALDAAQQKGVELKYAVLSLGPSIAGDTAQVAGKFASYCSVMKSLRESKRHPAPFCLLIGGETTVVLPPDHGLGGRNQEFVLAFLNRLGRGGMKGITVLSGGTDGEDGPTDAAGAIADAELLVEAERRGLLPADYLARHDAYHFFEPLGGLLKTGLTHTNVMDLRVILIKPTE